MPVYLTASGELHRDDSSTHFECPHCGSVAHMSVAAAPAFLDLHRHRPAQTGVVLRCDACAMPVFLRYRIKDFTADRVDFHPAAHEIERPPERYSFQYLPPAVAAAFQDALGCYAHDLLRPFAAMCRVTARAVFADRGETGRLRLFDRVAEVQDLGQVDDATFSIVRSVIFDTAARDADPIQLNRLQAAVLLETMKDMLHEAYVRGGKLRQALGMRRFFADRDHDPGSPSGGDASKAAAG
jgi:hypothetical protein